MDFLPTKPVIKLRFNYSSIVKQIVTANGEWHAVDPNQIAGVTKAAKQKSILVAGQLRGVKFQSTSQKDGLLYFRLISAAVAQ